MEKSSVANKIVLTVSELAFFCLWIDKSLYGLCMGLVAVFLFLWIWHSNFFACINIKDKKYFVLGIIFNLFAAIGFYFKWSASWDVQNIAARIGIPTTLLVCTVAFVGIVAAIPFTASLFTHVLHPIETTDNDASDGENNWNRTILYTGIILAAIGIIVLIFMSFSDDIWVDEVFSLNIIKHSYKEIVTLTAGDVHPPLYYFILKFFVDGAHLILPDVSSIYFAKLTSVIPYIILVIMCITTIRKKWGSYVSGMAALAVVGMNYLINYAVEIRMFGWGLLFVTIALLSAEEILRGKAKAWVLFVLFSLCAAYTHYFALVAVAVIYLLLFIWFIINSRKKIIQWLIAAIITIIGYIPWLFVFFEQAQKVSESYWISAITVSSVYEYIIYIFGNPIFIVLAISVLMTFFRHLKENAEDSTFSISVFGILVPIGTVVVGIVASILIRPVFVSRYIISGLFCFWLGMIIAVNRCTKNNIKKLVAAIMIVMCIVNISWFTYSQYGDRVESSKTVAFLSSNENAVYISDYDHVLGTIAYWSDEPCYCWGVEFTASPTTVYDNLEGSLYSTDEILEILETGKTIYFIQYSEGTIDELLVDGKLEAIEIGSFRAEADGLITYQIVESGD